MQFVPLLFRRLASYNTWMTGKTYRAAEQMSDAERKQDRGAFFGSIHSTLNHILFSDREWMRRFTGTTYEITDLGVDLFEDFEELKTEPLSMCADIEDFTTEITSEWLSGSEEWTGSRGENTPG